MIQLLGATPLAAACGSSGASPDAGGIDAGASDAFVADAFSGDAASSDAAQVCAPTHDDALGPFFEDGAPSRTELAALDEPGQRLFVQGTLVDAACRPLEGYVLDVWQADAEGNYPDAAASGYRLRGRLVTAADGTFALESIVPGYETPTGPRPAHLHVRVWNTAGVDRLVTQLYFAGDRFLGPADGCQPPTCFSGDADRVLALEPGRVNGRDGVIARPRLVLA